MMNTYRPDLARTLSTAELLALRFDPTISREMVRNLAREGEAYLGRAATRSPPAGFISAISWAWKARIKCCRRRVRRN